ncbi:MAG TPA: hypothetical protein VGH27_19235 [Streptosporangiaceae bacterium]
MPEARSVQAVSEPSWLRVLATTIRLWLRRRRSRWIPWAVLIVVLGLIAGSVVTLSRRSPKGTGDLRGFDQGLSPATAAAGQAARWVDSQVGRGTLVSCDPAMCATLRQHGFPASNLVVLRPGALDPLDSDLVVVTSVVGRELGARLAAVAPAVLASFGTGQAGIEIRAIAADGPAAYRSASRADTAARSEVGTQLLSNPDVAASPQARQQLTQGHVDARLIAVLSMVAALHPVRLVSFGDASPGAGASMPLRSAVLDSTASLASLRTLLMAQDPPYRPAGAAIVAPAAGQHALRVWYSAPEPLGLLNATQPLIKIASPK